MSTTTHGASEKMAVTAAQNDTASTEDVRFQPLYTVPRAAHYLKMPASTLRTWVAGYEYETLEGETHSDPVIEPPRSEEGLRLSFTNLIEAYVILSLRTVHEVSMSAVREAVGFAERQLGIDHLLVRDELRTSGGDIFLHRYGELIELSRSGQYAIEAVLEDFLDRVEYDPDHLAGRFFPFLTGIGSNDPAIVAIDPRISFGRPVLRRKGVTTAVIVERIDAGEPVELVADDYGLSEEEISQAVVYERAV